MTSGFRIGDYVVIPSRNVLIGPAGEEPLQPKVMELLVCLATAAGEVIGHNKILDTVWPNEAVGPQNLASAIHKLRDALGDKAKPHRYIGTVHRRGHCLLCPVREATEAEILGGPQPANTDQADVHGGPAETVPRLRPTELLTFAAAGALCAGAAVFLYGWAFARHELISANPLTAGLILLALAIVALLIRRQILGAGEGQKSKVVTAARASAAVAGASVAVSAYALFATLQPAMPALAVLPFQADAKVTANIAGLAESLQQILTEVGGVRVKAWLSSSRFGAGPKQPPPETICQLLGVSYLINGRASLKEGQLHLRIFLVDKDGFELAARELVVVSERVDEGFPVMADELIADAARLLKLDGFQPGFFQRRHERKNGAFTQYVRGVEQMRLRTPASLEAAIRHFNAAIRIDADYALAHASLAHVYHLMVDHGNLSSTQAARLMEPHVVNALRLDPDLAQAVAARGAMEGRQGRSDDAVRSYRRAIVLNPNYELPYIWLGVLLQRQHNIREALEVLTVASELDPLDPAIQTNIAWALLSAGRKEQGLAVLRKAHEQNPRTLFVVAHLAYWTRHYGDVDGGLTWARTAARIDSTSPLTMMTLARCLFFAGQTDEAALWLDRAIAAAPQNDWIASTAAELRYLMGDLEALLAATAAYLAADTDATSDMSRDMAGWRAVGLLALDENAESAAWFERADTDDPATFSPARRTFLLSAAAVAQRRLGNDELANRLIGRGGRAASLARAAGWKTPELRMREAAVAALSGDDAGALALLHSAVSEGFAETAWLKVDPAWSRIRPAPGFQAVLTQLQRRGRSKDD